MAESGETGVITISSLQDTAQTSIFLIEMVLHLESILICQRHAHIKADLKQQIYSGRRVMLP